MKSRIRLPVWSSLSVTQDSSYRLIINNIIVYYLSIILLKMSVLSNLHILTHTFSYTKTKKKKILSQLKPKEVLYFTSLKARLTFSHDQARSIKLQIYAM